MASTTGGPGPATEPTPKPASGASVPPSASPDEQAELVRLRAEVERLRAQVGQAPDGGTGPSTIGLVPVLAEPWSSRC